MKTDGWMAARPFNGPTDGGTDECGPEREGESREAADDVDG